MTLNILRACRFSVLSILFETNASVFSDFSFNIITIPLKDLHVEAGADVEADADVEAGIAVEVDNELTIKSNFAVGRWTSSDCDVSIVWHCECIAKGDSTKVRTMLKNSCCSAVSSWNTKLHYYFTTKIYNN